MSEVKTYMVIGRINKPNLKTVFRKKIRSLKPEHAIEEIYKLVGSKHRVKRFQIKIIEVKEVSEEEKH
ncbi:MAG: 50S ribosomal protein L18Ae, partial [Candidatus Bathyarchaeia archaeon]